MVEVRFFGPRRTGRGLREVALYTGSTPVGDSLVLSLVQRDEGISCLVAYTVVEARHYDVVAEVSMGHYVGGDYFCGGSRATTIRFGNLFNGR